MTGIIYSEERGTWNYFRDGEWVWEGTYEQCERMWNIDVQSECEEYDY